ncbi:hypothetical protein F8388_026565 [Cannabis sativa]|uniref:Uncharacterized protein n=1 Tax=Cannabis sativa TaxID=3483 RepID=A0A7J6EA28_CANSA|nr:hypothetical protein F8388_026565 [Cannabis sativa]
MLRSCRLTIFSSSSWQEGFHCSTREPKMLTTCPMSGLRYGFRAVQCLANSTTLYMLSTIVSSSGSRASSIAIRIYSTPRATSNAIVTLCFHDTNNTKRTKIITAITIPAIIPAETRLPFLVPFALPSVELLEPEPEPEDPPLSELGVFPSKRLPVVVNFTLGGKLGISPHSWITQIPSNLKQSHNLSITRSRSTLTETISTIKLNIGD